MREEARTCSLYPVAAADTTSTSMAGWLLLCSLMVMCVLGEGAGISGNGFYCRDPDTGKLYPVNTTWPSSMFCGSYTCKLRRKNATDIGNTTFVRQLNITKSLDNNVHLNNKGISLKEDTKGNNNQNNAIVQNEIKTPFRHSEARTDVLLNEENMRNIIKQRIKNNDGVKDGDRYLTEDEIKSLNDLLHTIKRSDLEAIIEMYNLAQEVYKEMDAATDENLIEETIKELKDNKLIKKNNKNHASYWYEPLPGSLLKHKIGEIDAFKEMVEPFDVIKINTKDMQTEGSNVSPVIRPSNNLPYYAGAITNEDFRKLPYYYYPMSSFQRLSSYLHPQTYVNLGSNTPQEIIVIPTLPANILANSIPQTDILQNEKQQKTTASDSNKKSIAHNSKLPDIVQQNNIPKGPKIKPSCTHTLGNLKYLHIQPSWVNRIIKKPFNVESQRKIKRYDDTDKKNGHVTKTESEPDVNLWKYVDLYKKRYNNYVPGYVGTAYVARIPHAVLVNSELVKEKSNKYSKPTATIGNEKEKMPDWQTNQLSKSVLEEVKANVESKPKLFPHPLRKHVKLERVGKVIKLEEFVRPKRETNHKEGTQDIYSAELADMYEVYIDKSICDSDNEPGFFRVGNLTEPFPACCPQRIGKNR